MVEMMEQAFDYLSTCPYCLVALDPTSGKPIKVNDTFEQYLGPLYKFKEYAFSSAASDDGDHQSKLSEAIQLVCNGQESASVRNVEMVTLAKGLPIHKHFDWKISMDSTTKTAAAVLLFGDPLTSDSIEQRAKDEELIDFFQNAPIALHWLNDQGIVLWANNTEMQVLGYTAEEYIGQPIMKFCPDEQELVLEIFKQLGSGNTIRDVPVRFRTKDNRIVRLLIDSNVKYNKNGSFGHTRCFIRDDTGRQIREAKARLLLEETKRSLVMLDNFMSRSLHHIRTPMHVLSNTCDFVMNSLEARLVNGSATEGERASMQLLQDANQHIENAMTMINDITDLAKFDQGLEYPLKTGTVKLKELGVNLINSCARNGKSAMNNVNVELVLDGGGPAVIQSDGTILGRVLSRLLDNAMAAVTRSQEGMKNVALCIGYNSMGRCTFAVQDTGGGLVGASELVDCEMTDCGTLPRIFQRYHQEMLPEETLDFDQAQDLRTRIEEGISSQRKNGLGIGLSVSYHLVGALGGDLRHSSQHGLTKLWFSLPEECSKVDVSSALEKTTISAQTTIVTCDDHQYKKQSPIHGDHKAALGPPLPPVWIGENKKRKLEHDEGKQQPVQIIEDIASPVSVPKKCIAAQGLAAASPVGPSVLVVEDTNACAKLMRLMLQKMNCPSTRAENGQEAVELLQAAQTSNMADMYNLILMDLRMPVMDGMEAARIIKHELKLDIPIVALTGDGGDDIRKKCDDIGFDGFCTKPMKRAQLKELVEKHTFLRDS